MIIIKPPTVNKIMSLIDPGIPTIGISTTRIPRIKINLILLTMALSVPKRMRQW